MLVKFVGFDEFEKFLDVPFELNSRGKRALPMEWRMPMKRQHCGKHPQLLFGALTLEQTIDVQKQCCFNDSFGQTKVRVFRLDQDKAGNYFYKEDTRY